LKEPGPGDAARHGAAGSLAAFVVKACARFDHDLRSELGTILNLASIQEAVEPHDAEVVRRAAAQIREHTQVIAALWQAVQEAMALATGGGHRERGELAPIVRSLARECGVTLAEDPDGAARSDPRRPIDHDPALVAFTVRAFLELLRRSPAAATAAWRFAIRRDDGGATLEVRRDAPKSDESPAIRGVDAFLRAGSANEGRIWRSALHAAAALAQLGGGSIELEGNPAGAALLRMNLPQSG
jgi:hypothetical protein